jgi:dolichol-phosphate mannosyltransferase
MDRPLVIIPAYNEEETIEKVVRLTLPHGDPCVVNDASKDRTGEIVESIEGAHCIHHETNTHIPGGVLDGMRYALGAGYDYGIAMDAGLSHDPADIPKFMAAPPELDVVIGKRTSKSNTPWSRHMLSSVGSMLYNYAIDPRWVVWPRCSYNDVTSGYRRYSRRTMELLTTSKMECRSFDFIIEALMFAHRNGHSIGEVPIHYDFTGTSLNKKVIRDALRMLALMIVKPGRK